MKIWLYNDDSAVREAIEMGRSRPMKKSDQHDLRKYVGDLAALCGITPVTLTDGMANGTRGFILRNGRAMEMTVLADRGLDIPLLRFEGKNVGFYSRTGITHPALYHEDGVHGFLQRFFGGLLTTCGMSYSGSPSVDGGRQLGLHGPFSNTPAERVCAEEVWEGDELVLRIAGDIREACVFGENLRLHREMRLHTETDKVEIVDTVTNLAFKEEVCMPVYHVNFGYPLLDAGAQIYVSARNVQPRDETAKAGFARCHDIEAPTVNRPEECFFHTDEPDPKHAWAMLHNEALATAAILTWDAESLPLMCEWKCMMAGDYALGLEPTAAGVMGRAQVRAEGKLPMLAPSESRVFKLALELTRDQKKIEMHRKSAH